jgi:biopolymer transport protein TolQ
LDDLLTVNASMLNKGRSSLVITQQAWRNAATPVLLCEGTIRIGWVPGHQSQAGPNPFFHFGAFDMTQELSIVHLLLNASWVVQAVVMLLLLVSLLSWTAIFRKLLSLGDVRRFKRGRVRARVLVWQKPEELFAAAQQNAELAGPSGAYFASGMREYQKLRERRITDSGLLMDGARRAMRASLQREMDAIESNLSMLASVGSVSPYVGLFGTVWGIMHAFTGLAQMRQVTFGQRLRLVLPERWWPQPLVCLQPFLRCWPLTVFHAI